jgi:hypothetical protein
MTEHDKQWNMKYQQLVEFKRMKGHCMVPRRYEQNKSLGIWVTTQRTIHNNTTMRLDRKMLLDEIGFVWKPDRALTYKKDDKLWHQQYEKVVEFKRNKGHCMVPRRYQQDKSLGMWVGKQRSRHANNKMLPNRMELLDKLGFAWKCDTVATRSSTTDVRGLAI